MHVFSQKIEDIYFLSLAHFLCDNNNTPIHHRNSFTSLGISKHTKFEWIFEFMSPFAAHLSFNQAVLLRFSLSFCLYQFQHRRLYPWHRPLEMCVFHCESIAAKERKKLLTIHFSLTSIHFPFSSFWVVWVMQ